MVPVIFQDPRTNFVKPPPRPLSAVGWMEDHNSLVFIDNTYNQRRKSNLKSISMGCFFNLILEKYFSR